MDNQTRKMEVLWVDPATPEEKTAAHLQHACFLCQVSGETHFLCLNLVTRCNWFLIGANVNCDSTAAGTVLAGRSGYKRCRVGCCLETLSKLLKDAEVFYKFSQDSHRLKNLI